MPNMAAITVKKNDGTTDIVYTNQTPSAGDKSPAYWRSTTVGTAPAHQPEMRMTSQPNGDRSQRQVRTEFSYPSTITGTDGKVSVAYRANFQLQGSIPMGMPTTEINEAVSQFLNLCASVLVKDSYKSGFAPN